MATLMYDGSSLGEYDFNTVVSWCYPCTKTTKGNKTVCLFALLKVPNADKVQPVILKRNTDRNTYQTIVDEVKFIFGLQKMGTHSIRLRGIPRKHNPEYPWIIDGANGASLNVYIHPQWCDYLVFKANVNKNKDQVYDFLPLPSVNSANWLPSTNSEITEKHRKIFYEIQKILVFRELFNVAETNLDDILIKGDGIVVSIDEMKMKQPSKAIKSNVEKFFFPKTTTRTEILTRMLGLNKDNYREKSEVIRNSMSRIVHRLDENKITLVNDVVERIVDKCQIYYGLT